VYIYIVSDHILEHNCLVKGAFGGRFIKCYVLYVKVMFGHGLNKITNITHTCANVQNAIVLGA
jgi:hypothetical protein